LLLSFLHLSEKVHDVPLAAVSDDTARFFDHALGDFDVVAQVGAAHLLEFGLFILQFCFNLDEPLFSFAQKLV